MVKMKKTTVFASAPLDESSSGIITVSWADMKIYVYLAETCAATKNLTTASSADPAAMTIKALNLDDDVVMMAPCKVIRHAEMQDFWRETLKKDEVSWDTFWLHFPVALPARVPVDTEFNLEEEREAFQKAVACCWRTKLRDSSND